jgi:hypothetical protein
VPFAFPVGGSLFHGGQSGKGRTRIDTICCARSVNYN